MATPVTDRTLYLCAGTQSSGSTLISWCFLQRTDMDGILDADYDVLPRIPENLSAPRPWCKFTIASFRFSEVQQHLEDEGWRVKPLLVVRDARAVFNSLVNKTYGRNGTTADDPPIRLRLRRFKQDWQLFRDSGWPIMGYEAFAADPIKTLKEACGGLGLEWDEAMATWPKTPEQIAVPDNGNMTFTETRGKSLTESVKPSLSGVKTQNVPRGDLEWLEREFADMNAAMGYPAHVPPQAPAELGERLIPTFETTRRNKRLQRKLRHEHRWRFFTGFGDSIRHMFTGAASPPRRRSTRRSVGW
jgi:hypothetical protein